MNRLLIDTIYMLLLILILRLALKSPTCIQFPFTYFLPYPKSLRNLFTEGDKTVLHL